MTCVRFLYLLHHSSAVLILASPATAPCQVNQHSIRFYATGINQQDRVRIPIDDDLADPAPDGSKRADVGDGGFTIEFWIKGTTDENLTGPARPTGDHFDYDWITGNIVIDRDVWSPRPEAARKFGVSIRGGRIEFGTDAGESDGSPHTLVGTSSLLTGEWRHAAVVRDSESGVKRIYVDGIPDATSSAGVSSADLSYPNSGVGDQVEPCGTGPWGPFLVIGVEKHDADQHLQGCGTNVVFNYPGFRGWVDEVRVWDVALDGEEIQAVYNRVVDPRTPGLAGYWRFEEGSGTAASDLSEGQSHGEVIAGTAGNGEWSTDVPPIRSGASLVSNWALY